MAWKSGQVHGVVGGLPADLVGRAVGEPVLEPGAGEPDAEAVGLWSRPSADDVGGRLGERGPAELGGEQDERVVEHPPAPEVAEQPGDGAVDPEGLLAVVGLHVLVPVPVPPGAAERPAGEELDEPDTPLQEPPGDQAGAAEVGRLGPVEAVEREGLGRLPLEVGDARDRRLHPRGQLVALDPGGQGVVAGVAVEVAAVHLGDQLAGGRLGAGLDRPDGNRSSIGSPRGRITTP